MSLTRIGSIGINTGIAFAGVTTIVTLNTANDALSIGATVNVGSGITLGASGDIFATGVSTFSGNLKVGSGVTISPDGDVFATGVITATSFSGSGAISGTTGTFTGDVDIADKIIHTGDTNTALRFPAADTVSVETAGVERVEITGTEVVFNDTGTDTDFRIEGDSNANLVKVDAGNNRVGVGLASPQQVFHVYHASDNGLALFESGDANCRIDLKDNSGQASVEAIGDVLRFGTSSSNTERLRIDSSGNIVTGAQTSPTSSDTGNIYIKNGSAIGAVSHQLNYVTNAVFNSAWKYITSSVGATRIVVNQSGFQFDTAASGTAGNNITFSNRLNINNSGAIGVGGAYGSSGQVLTSAGSGSATTWSTITQTTINNNADNRFITGSGTANTLEGESNFQFASNRLLYGGATSSLETSFVLKGNSNSFVTNPARIFLQAGQDMGGGASIGIVDFGCTGDKQGANIIGRAHQDYSGSNHSTNLEFWTCNPSSTTRTKKVEIGADGNVDIADGDLVIGTSGHGIDFSAASGSGGGSSSAILDDYEEGTFTPALTRGYSSISYHHQNGFYTKIGNLVTFTIYIYVYQATGDNDYIQISLPFTSVNDTRRETGAFRNYDNGTFSSSTDDKSTCVFLIGRNVDYIIPIKPTSGALIYGNDTLLGTGANNRYFHLTGIMYV